MRRRPSDISTKVKNRTSKVNEQMNVSSAVSEPLGFSVLYIQTFCFFLISFTGPSPHPPAYKSQKKDTLYFSPNPLFVTKYFFGFFCFLGALEFIPVIFVPSASVALIQELIPFYFYVMALSPLLQEEAV